MSDDLSHIKMGRPLRDYDMHSYDDDGDDDIIEFYSSTIVGMLRQCLTNILPTTSLYTYLGSAMIGS